METQLNEKIALTLRYIITEIYYEYCSTLQQDKNLKSKRSQNTPGTRNLASLDVCFEDETQLNEKIAQTFKSLDT